MAEIDQKTTGHASSNESAAEQSPVKHAADGRDPIAWMARNSVAANLIMILLLVGGIGMTFFIKKEIFPSSQLDRVNVSVSYPGASPEEVEQSVILPVEEAVQGLSVVNELTSTARENTGRISIELTPGVGRDEGLQVITQAVDSITTFPEDTERPGVYLDSNRRDVLEVRLFGDTSHRALFQIAEDVRDRLVRSGEVTQVEIEREPQRIVHVEVSRDTLRELGLTLRDISTRISAASDDTPAGRLDTDRGTVALRLQGRRQAASEFAQIPIIDSELGEPIRLGDIADIRDGFDEEMFFSEFDGVPDVEIGIFRVGTQSPTQVAEAVERTMREMEAELPAGIGWKITDNRADSYRDRLTLLLENGALGLLLVLVLLGVFLQYRLAMWVTMGMFTSFVGAIIFLPLLGVSINMISMFAFLVALGIVVDDAIVVGENVYEYLERGMSRMDAAVQGVKDVAVPVTFGVLTNCVAFAPLLFVPGQFGVLWATVPLVVIVVFAISLFEALFILPAHLGHTRSRSGNPVARFLNNRQKSFSGWVRDKIAAWFRPVLVLAVRFRYMTAALFLGLLVTVLGYATSDRMGMVMMPSVPSQEFAASAQMPVDATEAECRRVADILTAAAIKVIEENGGDELAEGVKSNIWGTFVSVDVILTSNDPLPITVEELEQKWRDEAGPIAGPRRVWFQMEGAWGWWRPDIELDLSHPDPDTLRAASEDLIAMLSAYDNLSDVKDNDAPGGPRVDFELTTQGEALGLTPREVGRQIRAAFQGNDAVRFLRGPNEVRVRVKLPDDEQDSLYFAETLMIRTPGGGEVPLAEVATITRGQTLRTIERRQGRRILTVDMDVEPKENITPMITEIRGEVMPGLMAQHPGLSWSFQGQQVEMRESMNTLYVGLGVSLFTIYVLLAIPFKSYVQPIIVLAAVPFGAFGAILGHMMLGHTLSILSIMGIVGLSGVMVNDSLVMVDYANRLRNREGASPLQAIIDAGVRRFRPIMLTTLTTFGGLAPIIFETSRQSQFLIPMAISLAFGILIATPIIMLVVPCFYMIVEDVKAVVAKVVGSDPSPADTTEPERPAAAPATA